MASNPVRTGDRPSVPLPDESTMETEDLLISIKPEHFQAILEGRKRYELRKVAIRTARIDRVFIYVTRPVGRIVGSFRIGSVIEDHPRSLWREVGGESGVDKEVFFSYFKDQERGFAIGITDLFIFKRPIDPWCHIRDFRPPQSHVYLGPTMSRDLGLDSAR